MFTAAVQIVALTSMLQAAPAAPAAPAEKPAVVDGKVANPAYTRWAKFKPGATVTIHVRAVQKDDEADRIDATASEGGVTESRIAYKLLELTPDKAVVQAIETQVDDSSETELAPIKITYPAKVKADHPHDEPKEFAEFREGTEEIEIGGKKITCRWAESVIKVGNEISIEKVWASDEVPGGVVRKKVIKKQGDKVLIESTETLHEHKSAE